MKRFLFAAAILVALLFTGCEALGIGVDSFVGTWNLKSYSYAGISVDAATAGLDATIIAKSDKTVSWASTSGGTNYTGTWSKSDSTYTITYSTGSTMTGTLSSDKKTFTISQSGASMVFTKK